MGLYVTKVSSVNNKNYLMNKNDLDKLSFKGEEQVKTVEESSAEENVLKETQEQSPKDNISEPIEIELSKEVIEKKIAEPKLIKRRDIYSEMPIRLLGYTNELGEAIRPISPLLANLSWLPAIGYISADVADKYRQDEYSNQKASKGRASKQLVTQLLASVCLPTFAVKIGQAVVNGAAKFTPKRLTLNTREKISNVVIDSMKSGEHKNFFDENGRVNKELYKEAVNSKFDEILKHRKTHKNQLNPFKSILNFVTKPFVGKPSDEKVKDYAGKIIDRMVDERQELLDGIKPEKLSKRAFKKIEKAARNSSVEEKQSIVFDTVRKMEKGRMFNNRILKSLGGLAMLSVMVKPIDNFVEHFIIRRYVSPQIDNISQLYYKQMDARKAAKSEKV